MPIKNFVIDMMIAQEEGICIASYRCPDKKCQADHVISTIDADWQRDFPKVYEMWTAMVQEAALSLGRKILANNGLKALEEKIINVRDLN